MATINFDFYPIVKVADLAAMETVDFQQDFLLGQTPMSARFFYSHGVAGMYNITDDVMVWFNGDYYDSNGGKYYTIDDNGYLSVGIPSDAS